jgi:hypothetical protein
MSAMLILLDTGNSKVQDCGRINGIRFIPYYMKNGQLVQKFKRGAYRQHGFLTSPLLSLRNESW